MKRLSIILACVLLLLMAVAATPAFGDAVTPEPGAYVFPFSGDWTEVTPGGAQIEHSWTALGDPEDPDTDWLPPDPIPVGTDIWMAFSWYAPAKGTVQTIPLGMRVMLDINVIDLTTDPIGVGKLVFTVPSFAEGATYWSKVYPAPWEVEPFNPAIGAKAYAIDWWVPVGALPAATYGIMTTTKWAHAVVDLSLYPDVPDQFTPIVMKRGVEVSYAAFAVGAWPD
jgi:hypothetical protein